MTETDGINYWFGMMELPFLILGIVFAFLTARAFKGGILGQGMMLLAIGFLIMGVGHLIMQFNHFFHFNLLHDVFGPTAGDIIWFVTLMSTWGFSCVGFYRIYKASIE